MAKGEGWRPKAFELRQEYINTHAVVMWGIGAMGQTLMSTYPDDWEDKLRLLKTIDWRRTNAGESESADKQPPFVLADMRSRVEKMGGECEIDSQIGKGTKIKATVPLKS